MALPKKASPTSPIRKYFIVLLLISLPILGYLVGMNQQKQTDLANQSTKAFPSTSVVIPADWKTYTNSKYGFSVKYPSTGKWSETQEDGSVTNSQTARVVIDNDYNEPLDSANSVRFELDAPEFGLPLFYISVLNDPSESEDSPQVYNALSGQTLEKIFALNIGDSLDTMTSQEITNWDLPGVYTRLPDVQSDSLTFLVIENPQVYGGKDKRLFLKRNGKIFMIGKTYTQEKELKEFEQFYTSLNFNN